MAKSMMTGTVPSSGRSGTAAVMTQSEQTAEEHSTLEQQPPGTFDHPAWCVVWTVLHACQIYTRRYAVARPIMSCARSDSTVQSRVRCGRPDGRFVSWSRGLNSDILRHTDNTKITNLGSLAWQRSGDYSDRKRRCIAFHVFVTDFKYGRLVERSKS